MDSITYNDVTLKNRKKDIDKGLDIIARNQESSIYVPCSTQLSMKFQLLISTKISTNEDVSSFKSFRCCLYIAN